MLEKLRQRSSSESGFTLVELLVVMLILGILAAIAIPTFFNQRDKARDASAKEAARTAQTAMETFAIDNQGKYTGADAAKLDAIEPTLDVTKLSVTAAADNYSVTTTSDTGTTFTITKAANGGTTFSCSNPGKGGCPNGTPPGNWGA